MKIRTMKARLRRHRPLSFEHLETRSLLSVAVGSNFLLQVDSSTTMIPATVASIAATNGETIQSTSIPGLLVISGTTETLAQLESQFSSVPGFQYIQPEQTETVQATPNDPSFANTNGSQYGLNGTFGINAPAAWDVTTGSPSTVVVADIDTGIDYDHPDLYQNIWINQAEIPASRMKNLVDVYHDGYISWRDLNNPINIGPGKITDINGDGMIDAADILAPMVLNAQGQDTGAGGWAHGSTQDGDTAHPDDLIGWNFVNNTNNPFDDNGHGTHTGGIIGAIGNNGVGVSGVNWSTQIMPLKFLNSSGNGTDAAAVQAIDYAANHGAKISNNSWGGAPNDTTLSSAITFAAGRGMLFVAAAGNSGTSNDTSPFYPASFNIPNIIAVAATDSNGALASFSNYGAHSVAVGAPGVNILSTWPVASGSYAVLSGTSMATPFVAGTAALIEAVHPSWTYSQVIQQIEQTATPDPALAGTTISGGIVNAAAAVGASPGTASYVSSDTSTQGNWALSYGKDGFAIPADPSTNDPTLPSYASISFSNATTGTWSTSTSDPRALIESAPGSTTRIASYWSSSSSFSIDLDMNDAQTHELALYALDFDGAGGGRSERIDLINETTGAVINSQTISSFQNGQYLVWNVSGHVRINVTNLNGNTTAVLSGLFLGGALSPSTSSTVWFDDAFPAGAVTASDGPSWTWAATNPPPFSGNLDLQSPVLAGEHQQYFFNAANPLSVPAGGTLSTYVYLDPANPPSEVMLQWNVGGSWEHRAYWGANAIPWGTDGTASRQYMGALPATGGWYQLTVSASLVGLDGQTVTGMAFTLYNGRASFDHAGASA
jgi:subtilisin family serine protease